MSKPKKKHRPTGSIMGRSDIPFALRIKMQQRSHIAWSREQGARVFMYCFSVAAHKIHGKGYLSLWTVTPWGLWTRMTSPCGRRWRGCNATD